MLNRYKLFAITAIFIVLLSGCEKKHENQKEMPIEIKKYSYELKDGNKTIKVKLENDTFNFFNINESVVMLNMFATWCPPCKAEVPHLVSLQKKFEGSLKVIAVLVEEHVPQRVIEKFKKEHEINYFVSSSPDNIKLSSKIASMLRQPRNFPIPLMVLYVDGKYFRHYVGMIPEEMLESDIKDALKEAGK